MEDLNSNENLCPVPYVKELYIFNPLFGSQDSNETDKILYHYPAHTTLDNQMKRVGLCEAIIKFSGSFNSKETCDALHTQKSRFVFHQPETNFWFVMIIGVPSTLKTSSDGTQYIGYLNEELQDDVFQSILQNMHRKFVLLNEQLEIMYQVRGVTCLRERLRKHFDLAIQKIDASKCGIAEMLRGLQFYPLNRDLFLRTQCFINRLHLTFPQLYSTVLLQGEKIIWSGVGLDASDIQILYDYIVNHLLSQHMLTGADKESTYGLIFKKESHINLIKREENLIKTSPDVLTSSFISSNSSTSYNSVAGGDFPATTSEEKLSPKEHILLPVKYHMLIYKMDLSYIVILANENVPLNKELLNGLASFFGVHFSPLAKELGASSLAYKKEVMGANVSGGIDSHEVSPTVKFLYFNNLNLATKVTPGLPCDVDSYKLLVDLKADLNKTTESGEVIVKSANDIWVVSRTSNKREFYAIFNQKSSNILDIDEEMRKLTETHLSSIFFQE